jgi:hypothetical protein
MRVDDSAVIKPMQTKAIKHNPALTFIHTRRQPTDLPSKEEKEETTHPIL